MFMASSDEYYPWPSTLNISNFLSIKPWLKDIETSVNYKIWKQQMLCLLESQDLLGFINGEIQNPEYRNESTSRNGKSVEIDNHKLWRRTDRLVKGWILGSIGDDVLNALVGLNTTSSSREVWIEVENIFSQKKPVNAFQNKDMKSKSDDVMQDEDQIVEVQSEISTNAVDKNGRDVALELVKTYPDLATSEDEDGDCALSVIARRSRVFPSGARFNWWQNFIYSGIPLTLTPKRSYVGDIENLGIHSQASNSTNGGSSKLIAIVWTVMEHLVPAIKDIRHKKVLHKQAIELVKYLCQKLESWPGTEDSGFHKRSIIIAAEFGIHEVVELIAETFPLAIFVTSYSTGNNVMSLAIQNRHENVYNVIYQRNYWKNKLSGRMDKTRNNLMHMSAKLAPPYKLNLIPGAALQMQRELQWFKEMESIVKISRRTWKNHDGETPRTLFTKEHEDLKRQGEKWMKDTASSCSITAALIATVVFTAAFTVPGNVNSNTGIPIFWDKTPFILFAISDIISLFTSITSLLMFLSILTSRYAEEDFLHALPNRLCIGLLTLFVSITFMMVAFSATAYLTFRKKIGSLLIIPVAALACLSITSFAFLQFPILLDVVYATHGPGIFHKKSDRSLY